MLLLKNVPVVISWQRAARCVRSSTVIVPTLLQKEIISRYWTGCCECFDEQQPRNRAHAQCAGDFRQTERGDVSDDRWKNHHVRVDPATDKHHDRDLVTRRACRHAFAVTARESLYSGRCWQMPGRRTSHGFSGLLMLTISPSSIFVSKSSGRLHQTARNATTIRSVPHQIAHQSSDVRIWDRLPGRLAVSRGESDVIVVRSLSVRTAPSRIVASEFLMCQRVRQPSRMNRSN